MDNAPCNKRKSCDDGDGGEQTNSSSSTATNKKQATEAQSNETLRRKPLRVCEERDPKRKPPAMREFYVPEVGGIITFSRERDEYSQVAGSHWERYQCMRYLRTRADGVPTSIECRHWRTTFAEDWSRELAPMELGRECIVLRLTAARQWVRDRKLSRDDPDHLNHTSGGRGQWVVE